MVGVFISAADVGNYYESEAAPAAAAGAAVRDHHAGVSWRMITLLATAITMNIFLDRKKMRFLRDFVRKPFLFFFCFRFFFPLRL